MLLWARNDGFRKILAMLKPSGLVVKLSEELGLSLVVGFLSVLKISLILLSYG
jgi:hypothetical protein